jgi:hypothetical protein
VSTSFFEQTNFEQLIMSHFNLRKVNLIHVSVIIFVQLKWIGFINMVLTISGFDADVVVVDDGGGGGEIAFISLLCSSEMSEISLCCLSKPFRLLLRN